MVESGSRPSSNIQIKLRNVLIALSSLALVMSAIGWLVLSITESRLERHLAQSLADLTQITSLVGKSVLLAAKATHVDTSLSSDALNQRRAVFSRDLNEFRVLAERLPSPQSDGNFQMSEVPSIVRVVHRLEATTGILFDTISEMAVLSTTLDAKRRTVDLILTGSPLAANIGPRLASAVLLSREISQVDQLESQYRALPESEQIADFDDLFGVKRKEIAAGYRLHATAAMIDTAFGQLTTMIGGLSTLVESSALNRGNEMLALMSTSKEVIVVGALACLGAGLFVSLYWIRKIVDSLVRATDAVRRLAEGDNDVELPGEDRSDEIGDLANAFKVFKAHARERNQLLEQIEFNAEMRLGILNGLEEGVALFDRDQQIVVWNDRFPELCGFESAKGVRDFELSQLYERFGVENIAETLRTEAEFGERRTIEFTLSKMPNGGKLVTLVDLTDRRKMERRLHQAHHMEALGQLTGGIAHDFNNLLATISSNLQLIRDEGGDERVSVMRAGRALAAVENGTSMVQRLLAFARRQPLRPEPVDVNDLLRSLLDLVELSINHEVILKTSLAKDLPAVVIDPGQLENSILNLVFNARDAISGAGEIFIATRLQDHGTIEIAVRDTGEGMTPEVAARAFDPFFTTKDFGQGSGLGLSTVFGFVRQSGGQVSIESEVGKGTAIRVELPVGQQGIAARTAAKPVAFAPGVPDRKLRVLVVEDDDVLRATTQDMVESLGHLVEVANSSHRAMQLIERETFDVMLSDIVLGGGDDGWKLAKLAVERQPRLSIILCTAYAAASPPLQNERAFPVLKKPYSRSELSRALGADGDEDQVQVAANTTAASSS